MKVTERIESAYKPFVGVYLTVICCAIILANDSMHMNLNMDGYRRNVLTIVQKLAKLLLVYLHSQLKSVVKKVAMLNNNSGSNKLCDVIEINGKSI